MQREPSSKILEMFGRWQNKHVAGEHYADMSSNQHQCLGRRKCVHRETEANKQRKHCKMLTRDMGWPKLANLSISRVKSLEKRSF